MADKKLRLKRSTPRKLQMRELRTVQGAVDIEQQTRGFTGCEYCGNTNAPHACAETHQGPCPSAQGHTTCTNVFIDIDCWDDHGGYPPSFDYEDPGCTMAIC